MSDADAGRQAAESLRRSLVDYVRAVHTAYLETAQQRGADLPSLPLAADAFSVAIVAAGDLHVVATRDALPPVVAHEQPVDDAVGPLRWRVRFLDATVLPQLLAPRPAADVGELLGIGTSLYHLQVRTAASLDGHQAMHAGTGLANAHLGR